MNFIIIIIIIIIIVLLLLNNFISDGKAQPVFEVTGFKYLGNEGEVRGVSAAAVYDEKKGFAYFATSQLPRFEPIRNNNTNTTSHVFKIDVRTFSVLNDLDTGFVSASVALLDNLNPDNGQTFIYLATMGTPFDVARPQLAKIALFENEMDVVDAAELLADDSPITFGAYDSCPLSTTRYIYLAGGGSMSDTDSSPRLIRVLAQNDIFERFDSRDALPTDGDFQAMFIDCTGPFLYVATSVKFSTSKVIKFDMITMDRIDEIVIPIITEPSVTVDVVVFDRISRIAYFGYSTRPGTVVKVTLDPFQFDSNITLVDGEERLSTGIIDEASGFIYFGCITSPGQVVRISIADDNFERVDSLGFASRQDLVLSSVFNPLNFTGIFGAIELPNRISDPGRPIIISVQLSSVIVNPEEPENGDDNNDGIPISVFIISIISSVVVIVGLALYAYKKRKNSNNNDYRRLKPTRVVPEGGLEVDPAVKIISYEDEIELFECIGVGSMGEVYRGLYHGTDVAVKKLHVSYQSLTAEAAKDVADEMALHSSLRHPNIIAFLGGCVVPPNICFVMEYMPRHSLYNVIHSQDGVKLEYKLIVRMALDAARGMNFLHSSHPSIVHRDLKSHNLLVDINYTVKVTDFGSARIKEHFAYTLSCIGTPQWMAPEVIRGEHYTEKCDVYSFAIVLWELLAQIDPYQDMHPIQVATLVAYKELRPEVPDMCPPTYRQLMLECWDSNIQKRPSFREIVQRLSQMDYYN